MISPKELSKITLVIVQNGVQYQGKANIGAVLKTIGRDYPEFRPRMKEIKEDIINQINNWNKKGVDFREQFIKGKPKKRESSRLRPVTVYPYLGMAYASRKGIRYHISIHPNIIRFHISTSQNRLRHTLFYQRIYSLSTFESLPYYYQQANTRAG